jgi:phospholipase/carboxylesterase
MIKEANVITIDHWIMRIHRPEGEGPFPVFLMLHGWTGDENSMWVFTPRLPDQALLIAPRGIYKAKNSGYSWHPEINKTFPWMIDFNPAVDILLTTITNGNFPEGDFSKLHLLGFSQGTALAYSIIAMHPERVTSVGGLSGFLPDGSSQWLGKGRLNAKPIFVAHGTEDNLVPVDRARMSVDILEKAGADVTYCEDDVGHKLSAKCFHGLEAFYKIICC